MVKRGVIGGLAVLMVAMLLLGCAQPAPAPAPSPAPKPAPSSAPSPAIEWKYQGVMGASHIITTTTQWWADEIAKRSNSRLKINVYPATGLGFGQASILKTVSERLLDSAEAWGGSIAGELPISDPMNFPSMPFNISLRKEVLKALWPYLQKSLSDKNIELLVSLQWQPRDLVITRQVNSINDLKGLKLRAGALSENQLFTAFGAVPTSVDMSEIYTALERKTVEGVGTPRSGALDAKWYESAKYCLALEWGGTQWSFVANKQAFQALPADVQQIVRAVSSEANDKAWAAADSDVRAATTKLTSLGMTFINPSDDIRKVMASASEKMQQDWVTKANQAGYPGTEMMQKVQEILSRK